LAEWLLPNDTVLDGEGLEARACECYAVSKAEFDRLLGEVTPVDAAPRKAS
jgi:hypothetical protein